jgi:hypothetical protein
MAEEETKVPINRVKRPSEPDPEMVDAMKAFLDTVSRHVHAGGRSSEELAKEVLQHFGRLLER